MNIDINFLKREIKHCQHQIKIINYYLNNPSEIKELSKIKDINDLLKLKEEYKTKINSYKKEIKLAL